MWAHFPVVAVGCWLFGSMIEMYGYPGRVPDVVAGCGMWSSALCGFLVAPVERTRGGLQLLVDDLAVPYGA